MNADHFDSRQVELRDEATTPNLGTMEVRRHFSSLEDWLRFIRETPSVLDRENIKDIVAQARMRGVTSDFLGHAPPDSVIIASENYRESLLAHGFNPRQRAMLDLAAEAVSSIPTPNARIYAHEAVTDFALKLRGRYPRFIGSEFASNEEQRLFLEPIPAIDIARSPFPDSLFDLVLSGDVFEHVPDLTSAIRDTARILRPGGRLIATFPFAYLAYDTLVKARMATNGEIEYLETPEYHGNPVDPEGGSLVFQLPGWAILDLVRANGFSKAEMVYWSSATRGLTGAEIAGILLLNATR